MKFGSRLIQRVAILCWVVTVFLAIARLKYSAGISWLWITSPIWGLFLTVVALYAWADHKAK